MMRQEETTATTTAKLGLSEHNPMTQNEYQRCLAAGRIRPGVTYWVLQAPVPVIIKKASPQHGPFITYASEDPSAPRRRPQIVRGRKAPAPVGRSASRKGHTKTPGEVLYTSMDTLKAAKDAGLIHGADYRRQYQRLYQETRRAE